MRRTLPAIAMFALLTAAGCGPHSSTTTHGATGSPSSAPPAVLAAPPTTAEAACKDIAIDPNVGITHNLPLDEQGYAAALVAMSTDRKTATDARALVTAIGSYLDAEKAEADGQHVSLPDFTPQQDAVNDDCTRLFPQDG